ncbi:MAG: aryl-sulfate sulfotransferase, partial [Rhodothermales bacterium]|nr:aryl-sulfate sulfotransferase [Rhodothermales bacterium]
MQKLLLLIVLLLTPSLVRSQVHDGYLYVSPVPGSDHNARQSTIILRPGGPIDAGTLARSTVSVVGSRSGEVRGRLMSSTDGRTAIFAPDEPFAAGESVNVTVSGGGLPNTRFYFSISPLERLPNPYDLMPDLRPERARSVSKDATTDPIPDDFPPMQIEVHDSTAIGEGYVFLAVASEFEGVGYYLMMLNNDGTPFFARALEDDYAYDFKMQPNGMLSYAHFFEHHSYTGGGNVVHKILDNSFALVDSVTMGNGYVAESHDFQMLPNGHYLLFGYYLTPVDMSQYVAGGQPDALVSGGVLQELDADKNVVFQWRSWDYFDFETWSYNRRFATRSIVSEFHLNTVNLDDDGHIFLATPTTTFKINRQTGDVIWILGGNLNEFSFVGVDSTDGVGMVGGHMFHRLPNGNVLLYDNGNRQGTRTSRVNEFALDEEARTAELIWTYVPDTMISGWHRGNAQRLPNGNTLIGWGGSSGLPSPAVTEVNAAGEKVYELSFVPPDIESYRAFRFPFTGGAHSAQVVIIEVVPGNTYDFSDTGGDTGVSVTLNSIDSFG